MEAQTNKHKKGGEIKKDGWKADNDLRGTSPTPSHLDQDWVTKTLSNSICFAAR